MDIEREMYDLTNEEMCELMCSSSEDRDEKLNLQLATLLNLFAETLYTKLNNNSIEVSSTLFDDSDIVEVVELDVAIKSLYDTLDEFV